MWNGTMFVDLDWPLNASSLLSASAELLVPIIVGWTGVPSLADDICQPLGATSATSLQQFSSDTTDPWCTTGSELWDGFVDFISSRRRNWDTGRRSRLWSSLTKGFWRVDGLTIKYTLIEFLPASQFPLFVTHQGAICLGYRAGKIEVCRA